MHIPFQELVSISIKKNQYENESDRLVDEERKGNPTGNVRDAFNKEKQGIIFELSSHIGWKGFLILIMLLILIGISVRLFLI